MLPFAVIGGLSLVVVPCMWWIMPSETSKYDFAVCVDEISASELLSIGIRLLVSDILT